MAGSGKTKRGGADYGIRTWERDVDGRYAEGVSEMKEGIGDLATRADNSGGRPYDTSNLSPKVSKRSTCSKLVRHCEKHRKPSFAETHPWRRLR